MEIDRGKERVIGRESERENAMRRRGRKKKRRRKEGRRGERRARRWHVSPQERLARGGQRKERKVGREKDCGREESNREREREKEIEIEIERDFHNFNF